MTYRLDSEQSMLQDAARGFFEKEVSGDLIRELEKSDTGFDRELWNKMAGLGWMGLTIPEAYDGFEAGFMYLAVVLEELGRSGLASPYFHTVALGVEVINALGSEEQKTAILPRVAKGDVIAKIWPLELGDEDVDALVALMEALDGEGYMDTAPTSFPQ